jgi:AAA+ ATPase superfamily predicted ATPase
MSNPFTLRVLPPDAPFCDRKSEIDELASHAYNKANVVLFSPRRYGKTSLVKKVQHHLKQKGLITIYADFFMVTSEQDVAQRFAKSIYAVLHRRESLLKKGARILEAFKTFRPVFKPSAEHGVVLSVEPLSPDLSGIELLDKLMEELGAFIQTKPAPAGVHIVFDEFQEITDLKNSQIEGVLRKHIQEHPASYFFVGSRRRILLDIFNQRNRPFYQSAIMFPLKALPPDELTDFLIDQCKKTGKRCPKNVAEKISDTVSQYPYYVQSLAYYVYEISGKIVKEDDIYTGFKKLLDSERYGYEGIVQGLTGPQASLLKALATDPVSRVMSTEYMRRHKLSLGGIQYAQKKLEKLDLIEKHNDAWRIVDPVFSVWLASY